MSSSLKGFSRFRSFLWPIHGYELGKFIPLFLMSFFVGFNYTLLRNMKDAVLVASSGAEVIPFVKVWGIVPGAVIMTALYGILSNKYRKRVFYFFIGGFLSFFVLFVFFLYPLGDAIHFHRLGDFLFKILPEGFGGLISMIRYWSFSLFYVISELWSSIVLSMLFWGLANEITSIKEAGRFYGLINAGLNMSSVAAGLLVVWMGRRTFICFSFAKSLWHNAMIVQMVLVCIAGGIIMSLYYRLAKKFSIEDREQEKPQGAELSVNQAKSDGDEKFKVRDLLLSIVRSRYLIYLAVGVLSYNLVIHLFEVVWKDQVHRLYPAPIDFNIYMAKVAWGTGVVATLVGILMSGQLIRRWGWTLGALITPGVLAVTGLCFFVSIFFFRNNLSFPGWFAGMTPLAGVACFGSLQNILSRSAKFTFFDMTKEMAFIPLPTRTKLKGKAAIDGVVSRIGKSGGSFVYQVLLICFSSVSGSMNVIAGLIFLILGGWGVSIFFLGKRFKTLTDEKETHLIDKEVILAVGDLDRIVPGVSSSFDKVEEESVIAEPAKV